MIELVISFPRGQVRSNTKVPPLSLLVGNNYSVCSGVEEWMAEVKCRVESCGLESD